MIDLTTLATVIGAVQASGRRPGGVRGADDGAADVGDAVARPRASGRGRGPGRVARERPLRPLAGQPVARARGRGAGHRADPARHAGAQQRLPAPGRVGKGGGLPPGALRRTPGRRARRRVDGRRLRGLWHRTGAGRPPGRSADRNRRAAAGAVHVRRTGHPHRPRPRGPRTARRSPPAHRSASAGRRGWAPGAHPRRPRRRRRSASTSTTARAGWGHTRATASAAATDEKVGWVRAARGRTPCCT